MQIIESKIKIEVFRIMCTFVWCVRSHLPTATRFSHSTDTYQTETETKTEREREREGKMAWIKFKKWKSKARDKRVKNNRIKATGKRRESWKDWKRNIGDKNRENLIKSKKYGMRR